MNPEPKYKNGRWIAVVDRRWTKSLWKRCASREEAVAEIQKYVDIYPPRKQRKKYKTPEAARTAKRLYLKKYFADRKRRGECLACGEKLEKPVNKRKTHSKCTQCLHIAKTKRQQRQQRIAA